MSRGECAVAYTNRPYLVRVIREALEQHATPRLDQPGCSICAGALAALKQLEEANESASLRELLVELAQWSRVGERNGNLHTRIASALALDEERRELGRDTSAAGEDGAAQ